MGRIGQIPWNKGITKKILCIDCLACYPDYGSKRCRPCWRKWNKNIHPINWKGGRVTQEGYKIIYSKEREGYMGEHRMIMEQHIGRKLKTEEQIHHLNGIKTDNRIENLVITSNSEHPKKSYIKILQQHIRELENKINGIF